MTDYQIRKTCRGCSFCEHDKMNPAKMGICTNNRARDYRKAVRTHTVTHCQYWRPRQ